MLSMVANGIKLPEGCEIGTFTPDVDSNTFTVSHNLGEVPKFAICLNVPNEDFADIQDSIIIFEALFADPQTGDFDITLASSRRRNDVMSYSATAQTYFNTNTYSTYPASMTNTDVTFATGRYYSGKFKVGVNYVYILVR